MISILLLTQTILATDPPPQTARTSAVNAATENATPEDLERYSKILEAARKGANPSTTETEKTAGQKAVTPQEPPAPVEVKKNSGCCKGDLTKPQPTVTSESAPEEVKQAEMPASGRQAPCVTARSPQTTGAESPSAPKQPVDSARPLHIGEPDATDKTENKRPCSIM